MTHDEAITIINAYAQALMNRKWSYGDLSELPYAKDRIKQALIHGIKLASDPTVRQHLKGAYITLAQWQAGFAARRASAELTAEDLRDPSKALARIEAGGDEFLNLPEEVAAEAQLLMADLKALGVA